MVMKMWDSNIDIKDAFIRIPQEQILALENIDINWMMDYDELQCIIDFKKEGSSVDEIAEYMGRSHMEIAFAIIDVAERGFLIKRGPAKQTLQPFEGEYTLFDNIDIDLGFTKQQVAEIVKQFKNKQTVTNIASMIKRPVLDTVMMIISLWQDGILDATALFSKVSRSNFSINKVGK